MPKDIGERLPNALVNLEEIHVEDGSLFDAIEFARRLPKLRIITAWSESESKIDLVALNNDRKQLQTL